MRIEEVAAFIERLEARQNDAKYFDKIDTVYASNERAFLHDEIDRAELNKVYDYIINIYELHNKAFFEVNIDAYRGLYFSSMLTGFAYDFQIAIDETSKYALIVAANSADWRLDGDKPQEFLKKLYVINSNSDRNSVQALAILSLLEGPNPQIKSIYRSFLGAEYTNDSGQNVYTIFSPMRNGTLVDLSYRWELATFPHDIYNILQDILLAVKFYHDKGYLHGGIKPDNIYLSFYGNRIQAELGWFGVRGYGSKNKAEDMAQIGVLYFEMLYGRQPNLDDDVTLISSDKLLNGLLYKQNEDGLTVDSALQLLQDEIRLNEHQAKQKHQEAQDDIKLYEIYRADLIKTPPTTPPTTPGKKRKGENHVFRC